MNINSVLELWLIKQLVLLRLVYGDRGTFSKNSDEEFQMLVAGGYIPDNSKFVSNLVSIRTLQYIEYPGDNHFCTGVIISSRTILTAAHCVTEHKSVMNPRGILIVFGSTYRLDRYGEDDCRRTDRIVVNPKYKRYTRYDVALLRLVSRIPGDMRHVKPVAKRKHIKIYEGMTCITLGWGQLYPHGPYGNEMMFLDVIIRSSEFCKDLENFDDDGNICVQPVTGQGQLCAGDLGGPLMCQEYLAGIIGGSRSPCEGVKSMKFVNYSHTEEWIDKTVKLLSCGNNIRLSPALFLLLILTVV